MEPFKMVHKLLVFVTVLSVVSILILTGRLLPYVYTKCARSNSVFIMTSA